MTRDTQTRKEFFAEDCTDVEKQDCSSFTRHVKNENDPACFKCYEVHLKWKIHSVDDISGKEVCRF